MTKGPIQSEIEALLSAAFAPSHLAVINDSGKHSGHSGDDGSGESHFTVEQPSRVFRG
jgi:BolA family transcriptional regulator, general stress-responsive regulator